MWPGTALQYGVEPAECVPVEGNHPAYILYTSGTTGAPKGVVRPTAGHLVALNWTMRAIYDCGPGRCVLGGLGRGLGRRPQQYICYGPLIAGCTTVVYEGKPVGTPDAGAFWRVIAEHNVKSFFTAPTALRAIKRDDPRESWSATTTPPASRPFTLRANGRDPDTILWAQRHLKVPVVDHWWQTGNRLGHRRQSAGDRALARQDRQPFGAEAGVRRAGAG